MSKPIDIFIIGGGINGTGIARDAAGRGLSVVLCEKDDLAQGTSSRSGKLVHGGLRYLEYYEFRLVREALIEREVLMNLAPHIIWPMRFILPHSPENRPAWLIRLGLFIYDNLGGRKKLPRTRTLNLHQDFEGEPLKSQYKKGFEYSDCWVDDARLVILNALDAAKKGAEILPRTTCLSAKVKNGMWQIKIQNTLTEKKQTIIAKILVNASGPWVNDVIGRVLGGESTRNIRLIKGSHIIVPKFWKGPQAYIIQNHDKRVIFINPYEGDKALIGTTDIPYHGQLENVKIDKAEIDYLLTAVNKYFKHTLQSKDIIDSFSGVRPLFDDGNGNPSAVTRDYVLDLNTSQAAPVLNIFGGKITTFRKLSEHALHRLKNYFPHMGKDWTANETLPGGDIEHADFDLFLNNIQINYPWLPHNLAHHYARLYGTRIFKIIKNTTSIKDLGQQYAPLLFQKEIDYLQRNEWAFYPEDVLYRRTKHGLHMNKKQIKLFTKSFKNDLAKSV